jgi:hypothetical protein
MIRATIRTKPEMTVSLILFFTACLIRLRLGL